MEKFTRWVRHTVDRARKRGSNASLSSAQAVTVQGEPKSSECPSAAGVQTSTETRHEGSPLPAQPVYKVLTVGGGGVGKSSLVVQFMYDEVRHTR